MEPQTQDISVLVIPKSLDFHVKTLQKCIEIMKMNFNKEPTFEEIKVLQTNLKLYRNK